MKPLLQSKVRTSTASTTLIVAGTATPVSAADDNDEENRGIVTESIAGAKDAARALSRQGKERTSDDVLRRREALETGDVVTLGASLTR
jgi:hypothetical protein